MKQWARKQSGFTIVELLIVVVVIAILATITIVAYNGIRERAQASALQSQLSQAMKKVQANAIENAEQFPATLADAGIRDGNGITYQYSSNNATSPKQYCITATQDMVRSSYISSRAGSSQQSGICPGHNTIVWYESVAGSPPPIETNGSTVAVDTSTYRGGTSSIRLSPNTVGALIRNGNTLPVTQGQTITISLWLKTDADWNGSDNNSKIRFGDGPAGAPVAVCGYEGVKTAWTQISCSYTVPSGISSLKLTVGNNGSIGQIWFDDVSLSVLNP